MLAIDQLTQRFGNLVALDGLSLRVSAGECYGLLGPNGAGKSTLMSLIAGLRKPQAGSIRLAGQEVRPADFSSRNALGYCPQHLALYLKLSAEDNLTFFGELHGLRGSRVRDRVATLLQAVGLHDRRRDLVGTFSGGMQRRLNLAAALLHEPQLLLCDEPTVGVDPQSRNAIFDFLEARRREGLTIIYSTHYMEEATRLCDRIGIIDHGRVLAEGTLDELLTRLPFAEEVAYPDVPGIQSLNTELARHGELLPAGDGHCFRPGPDFRLSQLFSAAERLRFPDRLFTLRRPTLEAVFLHLTGRTLRD